MNITKVINTYYGSLDKLKEYCGFRVEFLSDARKYYWLKDGGEIHADESPLEVDEDGDLTEEANYSFSIANGICFEGDKYTIAKVHDDCGRGDYHILLDNSKRAKK